LTLIFLATKRLGSCRKTFERLASALLCIFRAETGRGT